MVKTPHSLPRALTVAKTTPEHRFFGVKISVIIPALNEEQTIGDVIGAALGSSGEGPGEAEGSGVEVIVSDGGSIDTDIDKTREIAERMGALFIEAGDFKDGPKVGPSGSRGAQMDSGARASTGEVLIFLHADTVLPEQWLDMVRGSLLDEDVLGGAFTLAIDSPALSFRLVEWGAALRAKYLGLVYGDQAIFVRRGAFFDSGGFMGLPLMEDVDLVRRLRRLRGTKAGRPNFVLLEGKVVTSPRRWLASGVVLTTLKNWFLVALYLLGVNPVKLYNMYYNKTETKARET